MIGPVRRPSGANASSSAAVRRRSNATDDAASCLVFTVPAVPPAGVPSGMRTRVVRGAASAAGLGGGAVDFAARTFVVEPVLLAATDVPDAVERSSVAVGLVPGAVSESGAGVKVPGAAPGAACLR